MIKCFFDDSGKESDLSNPIVCVAGYLAVDQFWNMFTEGWSHCLLKHKMHWLHMKDFMLDRDEYAGRAWDWPTKRAILQEFINIIKAANLIGFGVALDANAWREIPKEVTDKEGTAQEFCFMRIMRMVVERMKIARPRDFVSIYFDCDKEFTPARFQRFIGVREHDPHARKYFQCFSIAEPKAFCPLQAADLLAWETRKDLMRKVGGYDSRPEYDFLFQSLLNFVPDYESELWDRAEIDEQIMKRFVSTDTPQP